MGIIGTGRFSPMPSPREIGTIRCADEDGVPDTNPRNLFRHENPFPDICPSFPRPAPSVVKPDPKVKSTLSLFSPEKPLGTKIST